MAGLIRAYRDAARKLQQGIVFIGRKRLFQEAHGCAFKRRLNLTQDVNRPAFVGVHDELGGRGRIPHGLDSPNRILSTDLDLDQF